MKQKAFFIIFKGLSLRYRKPIFFPEDSDFNIILVFLLLILYIYYFRNVLFFFDFKQQLIFKQYRFLKHICTFQKKPKSGHLVFFSKTRVLFSRNKSPVYYPKLAVICYICSQRSCNLNFASNLSQLFVKSEKRQSLE